MNDVNGLQRPSFFPNSPSAQKARDAKRMEKVLELKRNSEERSQELKSTTQGHSKVSIPEKVKDFARIKSAVDSSPDLDQSEKVASLKSQIQAGEYQIDYDKLADKMLESEY
jgi:negative regulator of flagellin synthesis FlgM